MIGHLEIQQREIFDRPLWWYDGNNTDEKDSYRQIRIAMKELTGYQFDNHHLKWSNIYGDLFAISIHHESHSRTWTIHVWDVAGSTGVAQFKQKVNEKTTDKLSNENYTILTSKTEKFTSGIICCSGCKKEINKHAEVAGRYWAGLYCSNCWESKYKALEAKENYD